MTDLSHQPEDVIRLTAEEAERRRAELAITQPEDTPSRTEAQQRMDEGFTNTLAAIGTMLDALETVKGEALSVGVGLSGVAEVRNSLRVWRGLVVEEQEKRG